MNTDRIPCDDTQQPKFINTYAAHGLHNSERGIDNYLKGLEHSVNNRLNRNRIRFSGRTVNMINFMQTY